MKIKEKTLVNIIFFLSLFPYFKIFPISAEIQPIAAFFAFILLLCFRRETDFGKLQKFYFFVIITFVLIELCYVIFDESHTAISFILSLAIIFSPILIFLSLKDRLHMISTKLFLFSMTSWFVVGVLQKYAPSVLIATKIDFVFSHLISRWSAYDLSSIDRGVVMWSPEPSYAAHNLLFMLMFAIFLYKDKRISRNALVCCVLMFGISVYLNLSSTMLFIAILFAAPYAVKFFMKPINATILGMCVLVTFLAYPYLSDLGLRPIKVMIDFGGQLINEGADFSTLLQFESEYGSRRLGNTLDGYGQLVANYGLGNGIGSWDREFGNKKPYSYTSYIASELGTIGFVSLMLILISMVMVRLKSRKITTFAVATLTGALFGLFFNSTPALPIYWIAFLLFYHETVEPLPVKEKKKKFEPVLRKQLI